ncbi:MAG: peptidase [Fibrobacteria bacterium]|nr:peptidase [Fibrobacteria bacterium]
MHHLAKEIISIEASPVIPSVLGTSREGREIEGYRFGSGDFKISLIGGCHADEPVGPAFLRKLVCYFSSLTETNQLLRNFSWWIVPHANPDGEINNSQWILPESESYDPVKYLQYVVREKPGEDVEFGFPVDDHDSGARPENWTISHWWQTESNTPFHLHVSLHGMGFAAGPWHLIEPAWEHDCDVFMEECRRNWEQLGYLPHDVERQGDKGFRRLGRGFCTRPDSGEMKKYFLGKGDKKTAALFRPSSMEVIRSLGGNPLTLVSEMPLFITPGVGECLGPPDPVGEMWKKEITRWQVMARTEEKRLQLASAMKNLKLKPMPVSHQMELQWGMIIAGIRQLKKTGYS